jgi:tRNA 2-thiouridine synthesizing protein E
MAEIVEYNGKSFEVDEDGFLLDFNTFSEEWMQIVMKEEGIAELNEEHKLVIDVLHDYYRKNGIAPMVRVLSKLTKFKLKHIYELFPSGPGKGACKMDGLPKPTGCV